MPKKSILILIGDDSQFDEAGRVKEALQKHAKSFEVEELQELDFADRVTPDLLKNYVSKSKAVVFLCKSEFSRKIEARNGIALDGGGAPVFLEGESIPKCLEDSKLKQKFVVVSFEAPLSLPTQLGDLTANNIFEYKKNISDAELYKRMKTVSAQIATK